MEMIITNNLNLLSATESIKEIKEGNITVTELIQSHINRIKEIESQIKAWVYFNEEKVLSQTVAIDEKIKKGKKVGPLYGVPVGIKDIFNTVDMPTCIGSPIWEGFTPGNDARVVTYIRWADGIIPGKTVTAEFAVHYPGPTVNPHNFEYSPGTSSSGSAAAVASFMVPLALGTQTAGSTIRPASYCGIYGFKPSFGLIPRTGILKTLDTLDHVALFARTIGDISLLFEVLRVRGSNYPYICKLLDGPSKAKDRDTNLWKVAFIKGPGWEHAEKYAKEAILKYVAKLSNLKQVAVEEKDLPENFNKAHDTHELVYTKALSYYFREEYENHVDKISEMFRDMVEKGRKISIQKYYHGLEKQNEYIHMLDEFLSKYDIIINLSTGKEAPKGIYGRDIKDNCLIWTLCHVPSMNLPVFRSPNGLPFGAQIVSRRYRDYDLLDFSTYLEREGLLKDWREVVNTKQGD